MTLPLPLPSEGGEQIRKKGKINNHHYETTNI
jgi:hypothetical protein